MIFLGLLNFAAAFLAAFLLHKWDVEYSRIVNRDYPLRNRERMRKKVWRAIGWTALIVTLAEADYSAAIIFGRQLLLAIVPGSILGACTGVYVVMWKKFNDGVARLAAGKSEEED